MKKQRWAKMMTGVAICLGATLLLSGCQTKEAEEKAEAPKKSEEVTFYIVRHGKTMLNMTDRVQGWADAVLTPEGKTVVENAGKGMKDLHFDNAYSSDSGRAIETAHIILEQNLDKDKPELTTDERLREFNFGSYEGDLNETMWTDIAKDQGKTLEEWQAAGISPENFANSVAKLDQAKNEEGKNWPAEDYATIQKRLKEAMTEMADTEVKNGSKNVLVVSHGLSIGALLDTLFDDYKLPAGGVKNASVTTVAYKNGQFEMGKVNDVSYIEKGAKE